MFCVVDGVSQKAGDLDMPYSDVWALGGDAGDQEWIGKFSVPDEVSEDEGDTRSRQRGTG
jgi:hypothetical protein